MIMNESSQYPIGIDRFDAAIFDLDGVITQTASVHAKAWKEMFDTYLRSLDEAYEPLEIKTDYRQYIDGKPRYDGVESFLNSRDITLPYGDPDDPPERETICGLGNRKNELFLEIVRRDGVKVFEDTVSFLHKVREAGLKTGVISSSKNCREILQTAELLYLFDTRIDGKVAARRDIEGKPAPDVFLEAAEELGVTPARTMVFEDAVAGVKAGERGDFGLVIGVAREGGDQRLLKSGADMTIQSLDELTLVRKE